MDRVYLDCETCGFHGPALTIQYAINDGPIVIHEVWRRPIQDTLDLIRRLCTMEVIGFNLAFDWFHIVKIYNILRYYTIQEYGPQNPTKLDHIPKDHIDDIADCEMPSRDGICVKPASALDLMLHFRKTELQVTMERDDMRVRRVPRVLGEDLAKRLTKKIKLDPLLFAGQKKWAPRFRTEEILDDEGNPHPHLVNVVLRFRPSAGLKALATHLLGADVVKFEEIDLDKKLRPKEYGYAPFAGCIGNRRNWNWSWPDVIKFHINHYATRSDARQYAEADVKYTRDLHEYTGWIEGGDVDSVLACAVGACRWRGYNVDLAKLDLLIAEYEKKIDAPMAPSHVKDYIGEVLNPIERAVAFREGTNKKALTEMAKNWKEVNPEAALRAQRVLNARKAKKKIELLYKLRTAGRFHASFKVIGALSGRMSGADKLNPQGIDKTKQVRGCFPLAFVGEILLGGDMKSFEISIAAADYNDPDLTKELTTCEEDDSQCVVEDGKIICHQCISRYESAVYTERCPTCSLGLAVNEKGETRCNRCYGAECKSFHALFGMGFFPNMTYKEIRQSSGKLEGNVYNPCKNGAFATLYGAQAAKLATTIGVDEEVALEGFHRFWRKYVMAGRKRHEIEMAFTSLVGGMGSKIDYKRPQESIPSLLGYERFFTLENYLIKELYDLAENLPKAWQNLKVRVTRSAKKGEQSASSAIRSALYGCAFGLQASMVRQAQNHRIQATGAGITKIVQAAMWKHQPVGAHQWMVRPMNIHDEIQCPTDPSIADAVTRTVYETVESFRPLVPLIGIDFGRLNAWADK